MKQTSLLRGLAASVLILAAGNAGAAKYQYQTVENDPLNTLMYTLPNGLKIFMTVNKDTPRIQTYVAVRVGGKNDPAETTGLAHYFEHLMFKGTEQFGTKDYAAEKPLLDKIEQLFETYRHTTDSTQRAAIYHQIDSISYEASLYAIPNEYDKLMSTIGADGTNAYTSYDVTCYVEDIPSNQIENWARIQADRFEHPVIRGFHTELETIYEEKNMSLTKDSRKMAEKMLSVLFPHHPYGTQTVLGTQEQLKNPSITNVKNYHKQWYVPNNMAICLSGDFDPDQMVEAIEKYFGHLKPNPNLPVLQFEQEADITTPIEVEVLGPEAENIYLAWRVPAAAHEDMLAIEVLKEVLQNGKSGLLDVNIELPQLILGSGAGIYGMADGGGFLMIGMPKPGQSLDDVRAILLEQAANLRAGNFSDELVQAAINNMKLSMQTALEANESRARLYVNAFVNGEEWADEVGKLKAIDKITKADLVRVANKYLGADSYVAIYKRQGEDPNELKLPKPAITPIAMNRDASSDFLNEIRNTKVEPIEPVFVNFDTDLTVLTAKNDIPVYYTVNNTNDIASMIYVYEFGSNNNPLLSPATNYLDYVGTATKTPQQINDELYALAADYRVSIGGDRSYVIIRALSENLPKAAAVVEDLLANAVVDTTAYNNLVNRMTQSEANAKTNQAQNFSRLRTYAQYGEHNGFTDSYNSARLAQTDPAELLKALSELNAYDHRAIYYGNAKPEEVIALVNDTHLTPAALTKVDRVERYKLRQPEETVIFVAPYPAKQIYMSMYSNNGEKYGDLDEALRQMYNEYFGGGMNAIVFQEMRESRSLAYSAGAFYSGTSRLDRPYTYNTMIATQTDKMGDAITAFNEIINQMPQSQSAFDLAKEGFEARMRTDRTIKDDIAWAYIACQDLGINEPDSRKVFERLGDISLDDIVKFQKENVAGRTYYYTILGNVEDLDMEALNKLGKVVMLTTEDIFGF